MKVTCENCGQEYDMIARTRSCPYCGHVIPEGKDARST